MVLLQKAVSGILLVYAIAAPHAHAADLTVQGLSLGMPLGDARTKLGRFMQLAEQPSADQAQDFIVGSFGTKPDDQGTNKEGVVIQSLNAAVFYIDYYQEFSGDAVLDYGKTVEALKEKYGTPVASSKSEPMNFAWSFGKDDAALTARTVDRRCLGLNIAPVYAVVGSGVLGRFQEGPTTHCYRQISATLYVDPSNKDIVTGLDVRMWDLQQYGVYLADKKAAEANARNAIENAAKANKPKL